MKDEKEQMRAKIEDLLEQQNVIYESNTLCVKELNGQLASLTAKLEAAKEQQVDPQPVKEHLLAQKAKMLHLQTALEEERCQVL